MTDKEEKARTNPALGVGPIAAYTQAIREAGSFMPQGIFNAGPTDDNLSRKGLGEKNGVVKTSTFQADGTRCDITDTAGAWYNSFRDAKILCYDADGIVLKNPLSEKAALQIYEEGLKQPAVSLEGRGNSYRSIAPPER
jgi:hypothetical protein